MTAPKWTFENKFTTGNILNIAMLVLSLVGGWYVLVARVDAQAGAITDLQQMVKTVPQIESRLSQLETRSSVLGPQRDQFQRDSLQSFKDINSSLSILLQQQSAILARLAELDRTGK